MVKQDWQKIWADYNFNIESDSVRLENEQKTIRWRRIEKLVIEKFSSFDRLKSIEIGAGIGDNSLLFGKEGASITLADYSEEAIAKANYRFKAHGVKASFALADMLHVPGDLAEQYDLSMSFGLAEHFENKERSEIVEAHAKVLRQGGITLISVPYRFAFPYRIWMSRCIKAGNWPYGIEIPFSKSELRKVAKNAGFHTIGFIQSSFWADMRNYFPRPKIINKISGRLAEKASIMNLFGYALVYVGEKL